MAKKSLKALDLYKIEKEKALNTEKAKHEFEMKIYKSEIESLKSKNEEMNSENLILKSEILNLKIT